METSTEPTSTHAMTEVWASELKPRIHKLELPDGRLAAIDSVAPAGHRVVGTDGVCRLHTHVLLRGGAMLSVRNAEPVQVWMEVAA